jgi:phage antirepressor YoqD-like protein
MHMYLSCIKYFCNSFLGSIIINNYIKHLKLNNMRFINFLRVSYFMKVHNTKRSCYTKKEYISMQK